ncbi:hypothetical protein [Butyrivibrio sp. VCB2006]|uniref:hypothetical protein n=1 Tax=Butyrivibrio sp. VCB2006 TaxID=1280679 RepID=UPI00040BF769|nr:hypothetical protein [Butyrivibrio sp. VCB2006]
MDKKVFTMALMTIFSAFILVVVIIYATNADKINKMLGKKNSSASVEVSTEEMSISQEIYGQQIGDDLKSFLYDEDFFDETEKVPAVVVIQQNTQKAGSSDSSSAEDSSEGGLGMAVVGQLDKPDAAASFGSSMGHMPDGEVPQGPIPSGETIGGTPVGNPK